MFTIKKYCDLRTQIDVLRATEDKLTEYTDSNSEISDEIDQGVISLVDKSEFGTGNYQKLYVQSTSFKPFYTLDIIWIWRTFSQIS